MKLLILSDTHGEYQALINVLIEENDADAIIFLGDGLSEAYLLEREESCPPVYSVRGNCDFSYAEPVEAFTAFGGVTVFYTHGNGYDVKTTTAGLKMAARSRGADVVLFGHTHTPYYSCEDGLHVFNPGSLSRPRGGNATYGIIEINCGKPVFTHKEVPNC